MAAAKEYAYHIRGNKLSIIEKDHTGNVDGQYYSYDPSAGIELPTGGGSYKSPIATVANGIQIEYTYDGDWEYITKNGHQLYSEQDSSGTLLFQTKSTHGNLTGVYTAGTKFLVRGSQNFSGIHEVVSSSFSTYTTITTKTKVRGKYVGSIFADIVTSYYEIDVLDDEDSILPVNSYQGLALVYYVKARMAEDQKDFKQRDYFMVQFHKMVEQDSSSKISGVRKIAPGPNAIR